MSDSPSAPWTRWDAVLVLVILVGSVWFARLPFHPPEPAGIEAPDTAFSAERAMEHLRVIARAPHLPGSPEHARVRSYLLEELRAMGLEAEYQTATWVRGTRTTRAVAVWNVVGRLPGANPSGSVLVMAHYDPVPHSSGANDDGTSVATLLETLRALREGPLLKNDLIVLFSDGEELGLNGAHAFVDGHRWFREVSVVLNFEIKGEAGASWMFETGPENGWILRAFAEADPWPVANGMTLDVYRSMPNDTDYSPFRDAGVQGLNFSSIAGQNLYHLALDNLEHTSPPSIQHQGLHALSMTRYLGNADLTETKAPDVAFTSLPVLGLVTYPPGWHWAAVILAAFLAALTLWLGFRRKAVGVGGVLAGVGVGLAAILLSGAFGWVLFRGVQGIHPEYGRLHGSSFHREGWYFLALVALSWAVLMGLLGLARRRFQFVAIAWGGALIPLVAAVALVGMMPLASMNLVWPVLFGEAALLRFLLRFEPLPQAGAGRGVRLLILGLLLLPVVVFMVPMTEVLWVAMSISLAPVLAFLTTLSLLLLLPAFAPLQDRNRWGSPILLGILAFLFLGLGVANSKPGPENPTPMPLFYTMDVDEGLAWWATVDDSDDPWIRARIPEVEEPMEGGGPFHPRGRFTAVADPVAVEPAQVLVLKDTIQGGRRVVRLAISSRIGAERLRLWPAEGVEAVLLEVNGRVVERDAGDVPNRAKAGFPLDHWGDPGGPVEVEFSLPEDAGPIELFLQETTFRPQEFLGEDAFRRPPHLIPSIVGTSDVALFGSRIRF